MLYKYLFFQAMKFLVISYGGPRNNTTHYHLPHMSLIARKHYSVSWFFMPVEIVMPMKLYKENKYG